MVAYEESLRPGAFDLDQVLGAVQRRLDEMALWLLLLLSFFVVGMRELLLRGLCNVLMLLVLSVPCFS